MKKKGITPQIAQRIRKEKGLEETKLQQRRIDKGLSQRELAEKSGVPRRAIIGYEQQQRPIDGAKLQTLCSLAIALDCKLEDILESKELITTLRKAR